MGFKVPCGDDCWLRTYQTPSKAYPRKPVNPTRRYVTRSTPIYTHLSPWQIRILRLYPGMPGSPIITSLHVAQTYQDQALQHKAILLDINEAISYDALSYSWGESRETVDIQCNGHVLPIFKSLHAALTGLRYRDRDRYVWADAICIDQSNAAEKPAQIKKMFSIYYSASKVVAWLGHEAEAGGKALRYLSYLSSDQNLQHDQACCPGLVQIHAGILMLCSRPWFERTWVRQEVFAARCILVQVGETTLPLETLQSSARPTLNSIATFLQQYGSACSPVSGELAPGLFLHKRPNLQDTALLSTMNDRNALLANENVSLDRALRGSSSFKATEGCDYIYGLISMTPTKTVTMEEWSEAGVAAANEENTLKIIDGRPIALAFKDTAIYLINLYGSVDLIFLACFDRSTSVTPRTLGLPSWVPDWKNLPPIVGLDPIWAYLDSQGMRKRPNWSAETRGPLLCARQCSDVHGRGKRLIYRSCRKQYDNSDGSLRLRGTILGTVKRRARAKINWHRPRPTTYDEAKSLAAVSGFVEVGFRMSSMEPDPTVSLPPKTVPAGWTSSHELWSKHLSISALRETLAVSQCFAPPDTNEGDLVVMLDGASLPAVLRSVGNMHELIGPIIGTEYLYQELLRMMDAVHDYNQRKASAAGKKGKPWPNFGPLKEDLEVVDFTVV